jgi:hypothetical protein
MTPSQGALPLDIIDIGLSAVRNALVRVLRLIAVPAVGVILGVWAAAFETARWLDPRTWPTPLDLAYHDGRWDFSELSALPLYGALVWAFSFIGCFQIPWLIPLWLATIFIQFC